MIFHYETALEFLDKGALPVFIPGHHPGGDTACFFAVLAPSVLHDSIRSPVRHIRLGALLGATVAVHKHSLSRGHEPLDVL